MTVDQHRSSVPAHPGANIDVVTTLESVVPADVLAEVDPALWGRTVVQLA